MKMKNIPTIEETLNGYDKKLEQKKEKIREYLR